MTLTVTDDAGDAATTTRQVTAQSDEPVPVKASFVFACTVLACTFTDRSSGPVVSRTWDFGDGRASDQQNPNHTYAEPGGLFNVTLRVMDDRGAESTAAKEVEARSVEMRDLSGTYERVTIHDPPDRHSRIEIRSDGTFELLDWTGTDTVAFAGRWSHMDFWLNMALEPGTAIGLDFDALAEGEHCGEAFGVFLTDSDRRSPSAVRRSTPASRKGCTAAHRAPARVFLRHRVG